VRSLIALPDGIACSTAREKTTPKPAKARFTPQQAACSPRRPNLNTNRSQVHPEVLA
jgi:hypothetical protein